MSIVSLADWCLPAASVLSLYTEPMPDDGNDWSMEGVACGIEALRRLATAHGDNLVDLREEKRSLKVWCGRATGMPSRDAYTFGVTGGSYGGLFRIFVFVSRGGTKTSSFWYYQRDYVFDGERWVLVNSETTREMREAAEILRVLAEEPTDVFGAWEDKGEI